eukprot:gene2770-3063_t
MFQVGFIGLGKMGSRMVNHLLDAGINVVAYDKNRLALNRARETAKAHPSGSLEVRSSPADVAADPEVPCTITMLANSEDAKACYLGDKGLFKVPGGPRSSLFIDCTTVDPATTRQLTASAGMLQLASDAPYLPGLLVDDGRPQLLDAPVTGAIVGAEAGTLAFMLGGNKVAADAAMPLLRTMGSHIIYCGDHGAGLAAKMCSLLVVASSMAAVSEALAAGKRLGLEPKVLTQVLNFGAARCWASEVYNPVPGVIENEELPANRGYRAGLPSSVVSEQLEMLVQAAGAAKSPVPLTRHLQSLYEKIKDEGLGDKDFSSIYRYIYGSGSNNNEWKEGNQLFSAQTP